MSSESPNAIQVKDGRVRVHLSEADVARLLPCAEALKTRKEGDRYRNWGKRDKVEITHMGFVAELAAHVYYYGWEIRPHFFESKEQSVKKLGGDGGIDIMLDGYKCDVKSYRGFTWPLMVRPEHAHNKIDLFLLAYCDLKRGLVELVGTIRREKVWEYPPYSYFPGNDASHNVPPEDTRPINPKPDRLRFWKAAGLEPPESFVELTMDDIAPYPVVPVGEAYPAGPEVQQDLWQNYEWSEEALECERAIGHEVARLYPYTGDVKPPEHPLYGTPEPRRNRVVTPRGRGLLLQAFEGNCMVLLDSEAERAARTRSKTEAKARADAAEAGKKKVKMPKMRYGEELPAGIRLHHRDVIPE